MIKYIIAFSALLISINCEKEDDVNIRTDPELISELITNSTDTLLIGSLKFVLDAYLWRDFMPISPPDGHPMISINWLRNIDSTDIPDNIVLTSQYVIYNDSVWITDYEDESRPVQPEYKLEKISRGGPKWGPGIYVDVISKVSDVSTNTAHYLCTKNVYVDRTD